MSNSIRIKRRVSGGSGAPSELLNAEIAYNEVDDVLYYGKGTGGAGGTATVVEAIAGKGAYLALSGNQTVEGTKTFSTAIVADITGNAATATKLATARAISVSGDATGSQNFDGSAAAQIALTLASSGVTAGTYTKITVDAKGRATVGATAALSELSAAAADVSMGGFKLTNVAEPVSSTDAATKNYVDSVAQGLDIKASVKVATTADITLSGEQTIDGVSVVAGDRVLVKNQSTQSQNGFYVVAAGSWSRSADADSWAELISAFSFVEQGTTNADTSWVCTVNAGGTLGSTAVTFTQFGSAGSYSAGNGLALTGSVFSVQADGSTINVSSSGIKLSDSYAGQSSITTVGTIGTGVWQGTVIGVAYGGLGTTAITGLVKGSGSGYAAAVAGTDYLDTSSTVDGGTF
jgi:hypothetical protein